MWREVGRTCQNRGRGSPGARQPRQQRGRGHPPPAGGRGREGVRLPPVSPCWRWGGGRWDGGLRVGGHSPRAGPSRRRSRPRTPWAQNEQNEQGTRKHPWPVEETTYHVLCSEPTHTPGERQPWDLRCESRCRSDTTSPQDRDAAVSKRGLPATPGPASAPLGPSPVETDPRGAWIFRDRGTSVWPLWPPYHPSKTCAPAWPHQRPRDCGELAPCSRCRKRAPRSQHTCPGPAIGSELGCLCPTPSPGGGGNPAVTPRPALREEDGFTGLVPGVENHLLLGLQGRPPPVADP